MSMSDEFDKWWGEKGANLVATAPIKTIAFAAYRAAVKSSLGIYPVGYQYGFHTGNGTAWMERDYYNGSRCYTSREIYAITNSPPNHSDG